MIPGDSERCYSYTVCDFGRLKGLGEGADLILIMGDDFFLRETTRKHRTHSTKA